MITVIDYGMGNIGSIANMMKKIGARAEITSDIEKIKQASKLILPGVGHFSRGIQNLRELNLIPILNQKVIDEKTPILGICVGMQLFTKSSEEGDGEGLGWFDAVTKKFNFAAKTKLKVPHMGWNTIEVQQATHPIFTDIESEQRFYFVHSYYVSCNNKSDVLSTTGYGEQFVSAIARDNIIGVQFHPEKSHRFGMNLLNNFSRHC